MKKGKLSFLKKNKSTIFNIFMIILLIFFIYFIMSKLKMIEKFDNNDEKEIPKKIYQTHETKEHIENNPKLKDSVKTWQEQKNNGFEYHFFTGEDRDKFMKDNFDERVYNAYKKLPMGVMKADLWRYCVVYKNGGLYADSDTLIKENINNLINHNKGLLYVTPEIGTNFFCQWIFGAPPNSPILKKIIDLSVSNIENMDEIKKTVHKDNLIHAVTGPSMFTNAIKDYLKENNLPIYDDLTKYVSNKDTSVQVLNVPEPNDFHSKIVVHLFAGDEGWKKEKNNVL